MEKTQPGRTFSERTQRGVNVCFSLVFLFSSLVFQVKLQAAWDNPLTWSSVNIPRKKMSLKTETLTDRSQDKTTSINCVNVRLSLSASIPFLLNLSFIMSLEMHSVQLKSMASLEEMGLQYTWMLLERVTRNQKTVMSYWDWINRVYCVCSVNHTTCITGKTKWSANRKSRFTAVNRKYL